MSEHTKMNSQNESEQIISDITDKGTMMSSVLHRLAAVLQQENELLETAVEADHAGYIVAKNQALRELMVMQRSQHSNTFTPDVIQHLREVRKLVDRNSQLLKLQVSALNDITSFLTQSAISEQGDGTYSREQ